jgi:hypothetical protein
MKLAALVVAAGSALFQVGAFLPVSRFYMSSVEQKLTIMQDQPVQWMLHLAGMGIGSAIAAAGLALLALRLPRGTPSILALLAVVCVIVGTALWLWHLQLRIADPTGFATGANPWWHFVAYTLLMQVGILVLAAALYSAGLPRWMPLVLAGGTLITVLMLVLMRDVPPLLHYVWLLVVGIGLAVTAGTSTEPTVTSARSHLPPGIQPLSEGASARAFLEDLGPLEHKSS